MISLQLPPLRDRKEDIPLLVDRFLEQFCRENGKPLRRFTHGAMKLLMDYDWPGNVRELENVVERAVVLSTQESMDVDLLPESVRTREIVKGVRLQLAEFLPPLPGEVGVRSGTCLRRRSFEILEEVERRIIVDMLERTNWNQTEAAERFQIPLSTLNQKIKRLGIETRRRQFIAARPRLASAKIRLNSRPANNQFSCARNAACVYGRSRTRCSCAVPCNAPSRLILRM